MSFGSFDNDDEVMSEINMTPLVDVMLVLLIIFIITIPVINHAVKIDLPSALISTFTLCGLASSGLLEQPAGRRGHAASRHRPGRAAAAATGNASAR